MTICKKRKMITIRTSRPEATNSTEESKSTCGFLQASPSEASAKAVTAQFLTARDDCAIISLQMFSFMYSHTFNLFLLSSRFGRNRMAVTCSGHWGELRFGNWNWKWDKNAPVAWCQQEKRQRGQHSGCLNPHIKIPNETAFTANCTSCLRDQMFAHCRCPIAKVIMTLSCHKLQLPDNT